MFSLPFTSHTLEKIELLLKTLGYKVRYEKGNFKTGACMLENSKVIVVNKFSDLQSKIMSLTELIQFMGADEDVLDAKQKQFLYSLKQTKLAL